MAWGRVPIVGNVRLRILSERMVPSGPSHHSSSAGSSTTTGGPSPLLPGTPTSTNNSNRKRPTYRSEKLVVRWTTVGNSGARLMEAFSRSSNKKKSVSGRQSNPLSRDSTSYEEDDEEHFTGLFEFEFDEEGRIVRHTIERAEQEGIAGEAPSTGVFGLGEWLLRRVGKAREPEPVMAMAAGFDAGWADGSQMVLRARRDMKGGT
ncbi:MAG: hypothetical protein M4579_006651 [Chaenotheca gracillima]|nr:MAG: hypothetical protein M4579_006651 [Chaenotheca gracillima]